MLTLLGGASLLAGGAILWRTLRKPASVDGVVDHSSSAARPKGLPNDALPVFSGVKLLANSGHAQLVQSILNKSGLTHDNNLQDVMPVLEAYAEFVQLLPASESHHHANPGGLLRHILEVVDYALSYRRQRTLPVNPSSEAVNERKHAWTYATFLAALCHDIGKPMSDVHVQMYGSALPLAGKPWQPMAGSMASQGAAFYTVAFNEQRKYQDHSQLSVALMQRIVPAQSMAWLSGHDPQALAELMDCLSSTPKKDGVLVQFVKAGDMESTRMNLLQGSRSRFKSARETPLVDILDQALCRMLANGTLSLNRLGGHGFVWTNPQGVEELLMVCPRIVDEIRKYLSDALTTGSRSLPSDNLIIYGTWMDFDRLHTKVQSSEGTTQAQGRAVWRIQVTGLPSSLAVLRFPRSSATFTQLKEWPKLCEIPIELLKPDEEPAMPTPVAPPDAAADSSDTACEAQVPSSANNSIAIPSSTPMPATDAGDWDDGSTQLVGGVVRAAQTNANTSIAVARHAEASKEQQMRQQAEQLGGLTMEPVNAAVSMPAAVLASLLPSALAPTTARSTNKAIPSMQIKSPKTQAKTEQLEAFEDWLRLGINSGHLAYNGAQAMVHFHDPDPPKRVALLVTPAIYQRFAKESNPELVSIEALADVPKAAWVGIQNVFLKAHAHRSEQQGKIRLTIFRYATKSGGAFQANVLTSPEKIFQPVPEPNPYISGEVIKPSLAKAIPVTATSV
jgi:integrating conjugative element relaxase (TIGR03760 family)